MNISAWPPDPVMAAERAHARGDWSPGVVWGMLAARTVGFAVCQAAVAVAYLVAGSVDPWTRAAAWWQLTASATSAVTLAALVWLLRREGQRYRDLLRLDRTSWRADLLLTIGLAVLAAGLALGPNLGLSLWLYGDAQAASEQFLRPLPMAAVLVALVVFPLTVAASELPIYAGYVQPRLEVLTDRRWLAVGLAAGALALQHVTLPLLFDWRFVAWRALMFVPFAVLVIVVVRWRARLLPYLLVVHLLADVAAATQLVSVD